MTQTIVSVVLFLIILVMLPLAVRWFQQRMPRSASLGASSRIVSALAVGPQQRVMTVEVGPEDARVWLVLGVTAHNITCLHTAPLVAEAASSDTGADTGASARTHPVFSLPAGVNAASRDAAE